MKPQFEVAVAAKACSNTESRLMLAGKRIRLAGHSELQKEGPLNGQIGDGMSYQIVGFDREVVAFLHRNRHNRAENV
ncbi:hypothetical protein [Stieleria sp. JC731]|uniref:hypothetical protein n=1 Tax=Pirellulaceae TaxID=2691357 RepID=UPI001E44644E|nr:hypothetical protein [Stieleria sp. JC731]